jgi:hypothetical protein
MQAKRVRREFHDITALVSTKIDDCTWVVFYLALALECDTPILEALVHSTYAFAATDNVDGLLLALRQCFVTHLRSVYPIYWERQEEHNSFHAVFVQEFNQSRCIELEVHGQQDPTFANRFQVFAFPPIKLAPVFVVGIRDIKCWLCIVLDDQEARFIHTAQLPALLEQQLARFEVLLK